MYPKICCDGESKKFCKIFWELNRALFDGQAMQLSFSKVKATVENAIDIYLKKEKENVIAITGIQWTWEIGGYTLYEFN
jgi:hypothetical protein